jgi:hypothetical protein
MKTLFFYIGVNIVGLPQTYKTTPLVIKHAKDF